MTENPGHFNGSSDEMDLLVLVENVFSFFRKYRKNLIVASVVGVLIGAFLYWITPYQYSSEMILHSEVLTNQEQIRIIENWNELLKRTEREQLADNLSCQPELLKKLSKITAEEIQKSAGQPNSNGFAIEVLVKDTAALPDIQKSIIYGLENNDYAKEKIAVRRTNLRQLIDEVSNEIGKLDSTKTRIENSLRANNNKSTSPFIINVADINNQMIGLNEKKLSYEEALKFANAVQVLQKFSKFGKPVAPRKSVLLFIGLVGGFFIGYIISLYKYVQQKLAARNKARIVNQ